MINEWHELKDRHEREIAEFLQKLADSGYSRSKAAQMLGKNTGSITNMVKKYDLNWPVQVLENHKAGRRGLKVQDYRDLAEAGFSKTRTAEILGVSWNSVTDAAKRHNIKFKDGRMGQERDRFV